MVKYILYISTLLILSGCVKPYLEHTQEHQLTINNDKRSFNIPISNTKKHKFNYAVSDAFTLSEKTFHLEYIELKSGYDWAGLADGYYQDFLRKRIKGLKKVSHEVVDLADIFLFTKDGKNFYLVTLYGGSSNTFIIDYTGDIVTKIVGKDKYIVKSEQFDTRFEESMIDNDIIAHYFKSNDGSEQDNVLP